MTVDSYAHPTEEPTLARGGAGAGGPVPKPSTYGQILKSTAVIGGSTGLSIAIGIVRTKAMAMLLGPAGFGLMGAYTSIADLARSVAEMGINNSGVRQIAESEASGDAHRLARTVRVLRWTAPVLGVLGALLLVLFAVPISALTFGTEAHAGAVALLSTAVFLRLVADGQGALIQGMRRISDLARSGVLGALFGTLVGIPIVYYLREDGVVPALIAVAGVSLATSWWFSRQVRTEACEMDVAEITNEAASLLKLGLAFMASGLLMMGAAYAVRLFVLRISGLEAAGFYQAAWTLGGMYVGFVLQAMGADFYPRLVGVVNDHAEVNRLVNEQAQVSMLLAGPGVIATLTFASLVIALFYSHAFLAAVDALRWICLGMALRVITWPMGFILVAKNERWLFFGAELAWTAVNVGLSWLAVREFGVVGAGIAFFGSYVFHWVVVYPMVRHLSGFRWSAFNIRLIGLYTASVAAVFFAVQTMSPAWALAVGMLGTVASSLLSLRMLLAVIPHDRLPRQVLSALQLVRLA